MPAIPTRWSWICPPGPWSADIDLRSWLFAFGGGIRIESPEALRQELVQRSREAIAANGETTAGFFPSRLGRD
jgi:hypothetical protein